MQLALTRSKKSGICSPWRSFHSAGGGSGLWTVDWHRMFFFSSMLKGGISETDRKVRPEYVPWYVDSSPEAVKCSFLLALILPRLTGHLTANGLNLTSSQRNATRASTARRATSCKNNVTFCSVGLTQNSFFLQDDSSNASINTVHLYN